MGDFGRKARSAEAQSHPPCCQALMVRPIDGVTINAGMIRVGLEQRTDSVMSSQFLQIDHRRPRELAIDASAILMFGDVALGLGQSLQKIRFHLIAQYLLR